MANFVISVSRGRLPAKPVTRSARHRHISSLSAQSWTETPAQRWENSRPRLGCHNIFGRKLRGTRSGGDGLRFVTADRVDLLGRGTARVEFVAQPFAGQSARQFEP